MSLRLQNHSLPPDISTDSVEIAELTTPYPPHLKPLSQLALAKHLSCRDKVVERQRKQGCVKFRRLEARARPERRGVRRAQGNGAPTALYTPLVS